METRPEATREFRKHSSAVRIGRTRTGLEELLKPASPPLWNGFGGRNRRPIGRILDAGLERALDLAERSRDIRGRLGRSSAKHRHQDGVVRAVAMIGETREGVR